MKSGALVVIFLIFTTIFSVASNDQMVALAQLNSNAVSSSAQPAQQANITILSPENRSYNQTNITLDFTIETDVPYFHDFSGGLFDLWFRFECLLDSNFSKFGYDALSDKDWGLLADNNVEVNLTRYEKGYLGTANLTNLSEGNHNITVLIRAEDCWLSTFYIQWNASSTTSFTVDTTPPKISTTSPTPSSELWSHTYGTKEGDYSYDVIQTSDGGYALVGKTRDDYGFDIDCLLVKTDADGNMEWNQTYDMDDTDYAYSIVETKDSGFLVAGATGSAPEGRTRQMWLIKTDQYGNVTWTRTYGDGKGHSLIITSDGGFAIAGGTRLVKTDKEGNMLWNKTYPCGVLSLVETPDGGYALAGYASNIPSYANPQYGGFHMDYSLVKTDRDGNMEWNKLYAHINPEWINMTGEINDYAYDLVVTPDGGYAIAGGTTPSQFAGPHYFWVVKTDEYGNMSWNRTYGKEDDIQGIARAIVLTRDEGFAIAGGEFLIKIDSQGKIIWKQSYENGNSFSLIQTSDGGFALAGSSSTLYDVKKTEFWLAKTDEYGIPEFPSWTILPIFLAVTLMVSICRKSFKRPIQQTYLEPNRILIAVLC